MAVHDPSLPLADVSSLPFDRHTMQRSPFVLRPPLPSYSHPLAQVPLGKLDVTRSCMVTSLSDRSRTSTATMSSSRDKLSAGSESPPAAGQSINMIMVEGAGGRHSEADRRRVRAAAARASAQASRETRQRNREDRDQSNVVGTPSTSRSRQSSQQATSPDPSVPSSNVHPPYLSTPIQPDQTNETFAQAQAHAMNARRPGPSAVDLPPTPLAIWSRFLQQPQSAVSPGTLERIDFSRGLPVVLPSGFKDLRHAIPLEEGLLDLMGRTACFDFGSPMVELRLQALLLELVESSASGSSAGYHGVQNYLRLACMCLVIFQGQRVDGQEFADDQRYTHGLQLAWAEARDLNKIALQDRTTVRAALWAVFIISATLGYRLDGFDQLLLQTMQQMRLESWTAVQEVLVRFIYPGSLLEEPCRQIYEGLHRDYRFVT